VLEYVVTSVSKILFCCSAHFLYIIFQIYSVYALYLHTNNILIGSGFESHTSRTRSERLTTCAIRPVSVIYLVLNGTLKSMHMCIGF